MTFDQIKTYFGGAAAAAQRLGVERQTVYRWQESVPADWQYRIERLTGGALKATDSKLDELLNKVSA